MTSIKTVFGLNSPGIQTSPVFKLPDELILSILSHISPEPQRSDHCTRFRLQYGLTISDCHQERTRFLRQLSATCKAMRSRLIPWIWGHLEMFPHRPRGWRLSKVRNLEMVLSVLKGDACLATTVNFLTLHPKLKGAHVPPFVKCLEALPNLHTLEIAWAGGNVENRLTKALEHVQLPQIKTLILPDVAHPLLGRCREVEDVCVVMPWSDCSERFLVSLASKRDSKVRRLSIPLWRLERPSRFVTACPKLTELTVTYPRPILSASVPPRRIFTPVKITLQAMFVIIEACRALPDFETLQIVHFPSAMGVPTKSLGGPSRGWNPEEKDDWLEQQRQKIKRHVSLVKDATMMWLGPEGEGPGRRKTTLRIIELGSHHPELMVLDSADVEEYEV